MLSPNSRTCIEQPDQAVSLYVLAMISKAEIRKGYWVNSGFQRRYETLENVLLE